MDTVCGTPMYMSPQILDEERYSLKSDIWSLGIACYQILTGAPPFIGKDMDELEKILHIGQYQIEFSEKSSLSFACISFLTRCL